jgi:hypothetical protein
MTARTVPCGLKEGEKVVVRRKKRRWKVSDIEIWHVGETGKDRDGTEGLDNPHENLQRPRLQEGPFAPRNQDYLRQQCRWQLPLRFGPPPLLQLLQASLYSENIDFFHTTHKNLRISHIWFIMVLPDNTKVIAAF